MDIQQIIQLFLPLSPEKRAALMSESLFGFDALVGMRFSHVAEDRVSATLEVTDRHVQPYGLVHGGVYATLGESACSVGAAMAVMPSGNHAVGVENITRFHRGTRPGTTLHIEAKPKSERGSHRTWEAIITSRDGVRHATSRVTVAVLAPGTRIAGEDVELIGGIDVEEKLRDE
ncbi:MAG: 1,4-dihydroxy-2-naphthoyl-CoA hydrolase [Myxococcota bacterium]|jgi:1,4-dihydroxy-2-naphthoyl-CoA hydrolase